MKFMSKLQKKRDELKKDNNGFSLVELIIVIAIMAILVGIVGTQVIPYINKSKEAKDYQVVSSYSTAAVTAYSSNVAKLTTTGTTIDFDVYDSSIDENSTGDTAVLVNAIRELTYSTSAEAKNKFKSKKGDKFKTIKVHYDFTKKVVSAQAFDTSNNPMLDAAVSDM
ncbi:MAG: type II secretion system protein [Agathobacter sp.]|nr:type II secretion system protein [Agathobacter sp.]